ncbi:hypothetical protein HMPREF0083_04970 [Aneurinibacillus aneurinilyticus ATCC 12856]|uniref:Uncharacterized protein n=1 Tax=Aneurinibacillus aneurinilyticus ATCC 12856 TaxID=649747 RepID=U1Y7X8_ANEAE|nr:hypothetical protein HMPREF0083_04970 [Aneurinibacillus aneurinilyticus ATCC 12856]
METCTEIKNRREYTEQIGSWFPPFYFFAKSKNEEYIFCC